MAGCLAPSAFIDAVAERVRPLDGTWEFCEMPPGQAFETLDADRLPWRPAEVPGTAAAALGTEAGTEDLDRRAFLFRTRFGFDAGKDCGAGLLAFDGLATLAEVRLNGTVLLQTKNMFRRYVADAGERLRAQNELILRFSPLQDELDRKRPRARWNVRMVKHRNLRFSRSTLLGRMHGWAEVPPAVGPWRGVRLLENPRMALERLQLAPWLEGEDGVLRVALSGRAAAGPAPTGLEIAIGAAVHRFDLSVRGDAFEGEGTVRVPRAAAWWPHDLGVPHRYPVALSLRDASGGRVDLGTHHIGFRSVEQSGTDGGFALRVNGRDVFCRGACWTPADARGLRDDPDELRRTLALVRDAGFNMLRVSGTFAYESDAFYDACDALGILVWQDFMFARLDYPEEDAEFAEEARAEAEDFLARTQHRACVAVLCGNSEVEQQAAMYGMEPSAGCTPLFAAVLPALAARWVPGVPYLTSSPTGGALPFHVDSGVAHYFGVGAYLRPLSDARDSGVRFASECLAFSNVPEDARLAGEGVPRDAGADWDFSDVTGHYVEVLFGGPARAMRQSDPERYLGFARVAPGEMMSRAMGLWRAEGSRCRGALVWLLRDLEPGAGWGLLDSDGRPKAAYWFLKRACAPRALWLTDEGLNGLRLHASNPPASALSATLKVSLLRGDGIPVAGGTREIRLGAGDTRSWPVDGLIGSFADSSWAYRFGPAPHAVAIAELRDAGGGLLACASHLTAGTAHEMREDVGFEASIRRGAAGELCLTIAARELALFVRIAAGAWLASDNYFHLVPGVAREVELHGPSRMTPSSILVGALNARAS
ncbi:MAG TPA: glycoside hydrolase family 2 protein, partial [Burkholderiales bacterium]|nr:glycoside hydrolase family 2 protein [Burkholderiales bacterium]